MIKRTIQFAIGILMISILSSCNSKPSSDAYGNFIDDATMISSESAGKLIFYSIEQGQHIAKGEKVAVVDTMQLHLKKGILASGIETIQSKAQNVSAQKLVLKEQLDALNINQNRISELFKDSAATQKQFDDINAQVKIIKQQIQNISIQKQSVLAEQNGLEAQIAQVNDLIKKSVVTNPIDGEVLINFAKANEFVAPGKPLYSIQDLSSLNLKAYISETQLSEIKLNDKVTVEVDALKGTKSFEGHIFWVNDKAEFTPKQIQTQEERQNLVYAIKIKVPNPKGVLKIGMPANISF